MSTKRTWQSLLRVSSRVAVRSQFGRKTWHIHFDRCCATSCSRKEVFHLMYTTHFVETRYIILLLQGGRLAIESQALWSLPRSLPLRNPVALLNSIGVQDSAHRRAQEFRGNRNRWSPTLEATRIGHRLARRQFVRQRPQAVPQS